MKINKNNVPTNSSVISHNPRFNTYRDGECRILVSIDDGRWHLSITHPTRYPTWDEIKKARYDYCPDDVEMAHILPPLEYYVNVHPNCFHLWEIQDKEGRKPK